MQHVKATWLRNYNFFLVFLDILVAGSYVWFRYFNGPLSIEKQWGINAAITTIALVHIVFSLTIYLYFYKSHTWLMSIVSSSLFAYFLAAVIETSGHTFLIWRFVFAAFVFSLGMTGPFAALAAVILTWFILIFTFSGIVGGTSASTAFNISIDILVTIAGYCGWLFFKKYYVTKKTIEEIQLTSLLKQEQFKSNIILESITDGVMVINTKGTSQIVNESAAIMFGWEQKDALGLDYRSLVNAVQEGELQKNDPDAISLCLSTKSAQQKTSLLETKNHRKLYVEIVASPILQEHKSEDGSTTEQMVAVIAILRDVDERKRQEQQRSDFISTASHEMRTPVASIEGFIELSLNPKVATIDEKAKGYLVKAQEATKHLGKLFQDLLTVSKTDDGRLANNPQVIEINSFLKEVVDDIKFTAEKKGLQVSLETDRSRGKAVTPLLYINADPERLREVITNLFDNAVKYTKAGLITIGSSVKEQGVIFRISDTGVGIAQEDIPHLFQKFYRLDNTATREIGGTGLGLYICKEIVEQMGGKVYVESVLGTGSTFFVELPRVSNDLIQKSVLKHS